MLGAGVVKLRPLSRQKAELLQPLLNAGLAEIALHGYSHLALAPLREHQEFSDLAPVETQRALIRRGRRHLEDIFGLQVRLFVPPWNRLAASTAIVLREEGLLLSGTIDGVADIEQVCLPQVPCDVVIRHTARALQSARRLSGRGNMVGTLFHDYDFLESGYPGAYLKLNEFEITLQRWAKMDAVRKVLVTEAIQANEQPVAERVRANASLRHSLSRSHLGRRLMTGAHLVYWDAQTARRLALLAKHLP